GRVTLSDVSPGTATATANSTFIVVPALVVTNTNDDGRGSLRFAINAANQFGGGTITFAVPSAGPNVLHLLSPLPTVTSTTTIDDTIQSPYSQVPPAPFVIDGSLVSFGSNPSVTASPFPALLDVNAPGSIIKGLTFQASQGVGLVLDSNSGGSLIAGNFIGTDPSGSTTSASMGNKLGGLLIVSAGNTIQGNVISGNGGSGNPTPGNPSDLVGFGVGFFGPTASGNMLLNNEIGTDAQGTHSLPNFDGVDIVGASGNTIAGNIIAGNNAAGVYLYGGTTGTTLIGNKIGIADAAHTLGNQTGVVIADSSGNRIGGFTSDTSNIVAGNATSGVLIFNSGFPGGTDATNNVVAFSYLIANGQNGVYILNASGNQVGTSTSGVASGPGSSGGVSAGGNLIQDNGFSGVQIAVDVVPGSGGVVPSGASSIGNAVINNIITGSGHDGIYLYNAANNLIGVGTNGVVNGNTIQGSGFSGVFLDGPASSQNRVAGNAISQSSLYGILINNGTQNLIGGTGVAGNLIRGNRGGAFQVLRNNVPPKFGGLAGNHFLGSARGSQRGP
ncbi:right-handed parallel beta-helix repeat-containing protein, partial [Singulisphaera rosea]